MLLSGPSMRRPSFNPRIVAPGVDGRLTEPGFSIHNADEKLRRYYVVE